MHPCSILLLPLTFLIIYVTLLGGEGSDTEAWRRAFVKTALVCGALVTASTEVLSVWHAVTGSGLILFWSLALLVAGVACWRTGAAAKARRWLRARVWQQSPAEAALLAGLGVVLLLTGLVAWVSPPNTTDSHLYHMSRVMHWAQDASLRHYPTSYEVQLWFPPWAETAILTLRLLWGNDQVAAFVQWGSYAGCLILAAGIAGLLGAGRRGRALAMAFGASIPMAVLQATSTQNDLVVSFWLLCLGYLILKEDAQSGGGTRPLWIGVAIGLGILTKGTAYMYFAPMGAWYALSGWRRNGLGGVLRRALLLALAVVTLNLGHWSRNLGTYHSALGVTDGNGGLVSLPPLAGWALNAIAHVLTHFASPGEVLTARVTEVVQWLSGQVGYRIPGFHLTWAWNHEDLAGSPIHLVAIGLGLIALLVRRRRRHSPGLVIYAASGMIGLGFLAVLVTWNPYVVRLHLPFLLAMAPVVGVSFESWLRPGLVSLLSAAFMAFSLPWVLLNQTRPVISLRPRTAIVSVFRAEKVDILFANWLRQRDDFVAATAMVRDTGCTQIGLRIDSHDLEYPYWWLLGAPQDGMRLEHVDPYPHLERYISPDFRPCAILCTTCGGRTQLHGLEIAGEFGEIAVFAGGRFEREVP